MARAEASNVDALATLRADVIALTIDRRIELLEQILKSLPASAREKIAEDFERRYFAPSVLRDGRSRERNDAIRALAVHYPAALGRGLARAIETDLRRWAQHWQRRSDRAWRPPAGEREILLNQVCEIGNGKVPSWGRVRNILAGIGT